MFMSFVLMFIESYDSDTVVVDNMWTMKMIEEMRGTV